MKKLILLLAVIFVGTSIMSYADGPVKDTIKIYSGDKTIIIVSKSKKNNESDLEFGKKTFQNKIDQYKARIDSIDQIIDSLTEAMEKTNDTTQLSLRKRLSELREQQAQYRKMISALQKGISDIERQLDEMESQSEVGHNEFEENQEKVVKRHYKSKKFKGHWSGIEFGPNSFLTQHQAIINSSNNPALTPELNKSFEFCFNSLEGNVKIFNFLGLVSGIGLQWNNYKYETFPTYSSSYVLDLDSLYPANQPDGSTLKQISLKTFYVNVPLLIELQFPFGSGNKFYVNFGGYAGLNVYSKLKFIYNLSGNKVKSKENVAKMVLPYHYGLTARIGIDQVQLFANYSLSPIFRSNQNPVLYPVSVGLHVNF